MDNLAALTQKYNNGQFDNFITEITFPYFKNIQIGAKIHFKYPLTVLIGQNGCGKSSCLQAIKGCPKGNMPSDFWFSTPVDEIKQKDLSTVYSKISAVWPTIYYKYSNNQNDYQVLYQSVYRAGNPDYWEAREPVQSYGMTNKERHPIIDKNVVYLDFRSELSAFDKYFYFGERHNHKKIKANKKQDYLRTQAKKLKKVFETSCRYTIPRSQGKKFYNELPINFTEEMLTEINQILDKSYTSATLINHKFFERVGDSILFKTDSLDYSEAFAGSGEMAASILVYNVMNAENNSLILLDEPEVSLHPLAQEKLRYFLIKQCLEKDLQIIVSTHSPSFVNGLPNDAIKVFRENSKGTFEILEDVSYRSAFNIVGFKLSSHKTILVEDKLAAEIVLAVIDKYKNLTPEFKDIRVKCNFGGATELYKDAANILRCDDEVARNHYIVLDGDKYVKDFEDISLWQSIDITKQKLDEHIREVTNSNPNKIFLQDSNPRDTDLVEQRKQYIAYGRSNIKYLPEATPDQIIWDGDCCKKILSLWNIQNKDNVFAKIDSESDYKKKFSILAKLKYENPTSDDILCLQTDFIMSWINSSSTHIEQIKVNILDVMVLN